MARMPGADWRGEHGSRSMSRYDIVCIHTIVGYAPAHAAHFSTDGNGKIYQSRDTRYRSAANLNGNHRVISIENADHGSDFPRWNTNGSDVPAFTKDQIEAIAKILAWANKTHGIPLKACPNSRPGSKGIAFHRQGIDGNFSNGRVSGGELWSSARGKVCPGDRRIAQIPQIIARAKQLVGGAPTEPKDWFDMATPEQLSSIVEKATDKALANDVLRLKQLLADLRGQNDAIKSVVATNEALKAEVHRLKEILDMHGQRLVQLNGGQEFKGIVDPRDAKGGK